MLSTDAGVAASIPVKHAQMGVDWPQGFGQFCALPDLDPDGTMVAAGDYANDIVHVFKLDRLTATMEPGSPVTLGQNTGGLGEQVETNSRFGIAAAFLPAADSPTGKPLLAVGAYYHGGSTIGSATYLAGAVHLIELAASGQGTHKALLAPSNPNGMPPGVVIAGDFFGRAVAFLPGLGASGGPLLAVGANQDDSGNVTDAGAVHLMTVNADATVDYAGKVANGRMGLGSSTIPPGVHLGNSLAFLPGAGLSPGHALMLTGAPYNASDTGPGAIYMFSVGPGASAVVFAGCVGDGVGGIPAGTLPLLATFGASVAALQPRAARDGTAVVVVGAPGVQVDNDGSGAVFVLTLNLTTYLVDALSKVANDINLPRNTLGNNHKLGLFLGTLPVPDGSGVATTVVNQGIQAAHMLQFGSPPLPPPPLQPHPGFVRSKRLWNAAGGEAVAVPADASAWDWLAQQPAAYVQGEKLTCGAASCTTERSFEPGPFNVTRTDGQRATAYVEIEYATTRAVAAGTWLAPAASPDELQLADEHLAGSSVVRVGDLDADGCPLDFAVGLPGSGANRSGSGAIALLSRPCNGSEAAGAVASLLLQLDGSVIASSDLPANASMGAAVAWVGSSDTPAGRRTVLVAGTPGVDAVLVLRLQHQQGSAGGAAAGCEWSVAVADRLAAGPSSLPAATAAGAGLEAGSAFGTAVAVGGLASAPVAVVAAGAPGASDRSGDVLLAAVDRAAGTVVDDEVAALWLGNHSRTPDRSTGDAFGAALAAGAVASDPLRADWHLFVGAPGSAGGAGGVVLFHITQQGSRCNVTGSVLVAEGSGGLGPGSFPPGARFGGSVAWLGDVDGDGQRQELAVGMPGQDRLMVLWLGPTAASDGLQAFSWATFSAGVGGLPATLPSGFGSALAAAGDWDGDGVATDVLVGAVSSDRSSGVVLQVGFKPKALGVAPWGLLRPALDTASPSAGLPHDRSSLVTLTGQALYEWDSLFGEQSRLRSPPRVLVSGLQPAHCLDVEVTADGKRLTCMLSASLQRQRSLSVQVGSTTVALSEPIQYDVRAALTGVTSTGAVPQRDGQRTFTGVGLLPSTAFSAQELADAGVKLLIGDEYQCPATALEQSDTGGSITCLDMPDGVGHSLPVRLWLPGGIESNSSVTVSYAAPMVAAIEPAKVQLDRHRRRNFTITGSNFGHRQSDISAVAVGGNLCAAVVRESASRLWCGGVSSEFSSHDVRVWTAGVASEPRPDMLQFDDLPKVIASEVQVLRTTGSEAIQLFGTSLEQATGVIADVRVGSRPCLNWTLASSSIINCVTPPGTGASLSVAIDTSTGYTTQSVVPISYAAPTIEECTPDVAYANASVIYDFSVLGSGFGMTDDGQVEAVLVSGRNCSRVEHVNDGEIICRGVQGPWDGVGEVSVTISGQVAASASVISFQPSPVVTAISPESMGTAGGQLTIHGTGFGTSAASVQSVLVGGQQCSGRSMLPSGAIECRVPPGVGAGLAVVVAVDLNGRSATDNAMFSYHRPAIAALASSRSPMFAGEAGVALALSVRDCGRDSQGLSVSLRSTAGGWSQPCAGVVRADAGQDRADELTDVACEASLLTFPAEAGGALQVTVTVAGQESEAAAIEVRSRPVVTLVVTAGNTPTVGTGNATSVEVQGQNFGSDRSDVLGVGVGGRACPRIEHLSETSLRIAVPPGVGADQRVRVTTRGGHSSSESVGLSYKAASVTSIEPEYALTGTGNASFFINGSDFGNEPRDLAGVSVGGQRCGAAEWVSPTQVRCHAASRARWSSRLVSVLVGNQVGSTNALFEPVGPPWIKVVSPAVAAAGDSVLLLGENFGYNGSDVRSVTVNGQPCRSVLHHGATAVTCVLPEQPASIPLQQLRDVPVVVTTAGGQQSAPAAMSYAGSGDALQLAPSHVLGWREVGADRELLARWAYPNDAQLEGVDAVDSFDIRLAHLVAANGSGNGSASTGAPRILSVRISALEESAAVTDTKDGMRVFRYSGAVSETTPLVLEVRAVNPTGRGPWSPPTAPVTVNCPAGSFLQTQAPAFLWGCGACPAGAFCGGAEAANVTALPGYWRVPWSRSGLGFAECPREGSCLGYEEPASGSSLAAQRRRLSLRVKSPAAEWRQRRASPPSRQLADSAAGPSLATALEQDTVEPAVQLYLWGDPAAMERCEEGYHGTMCTSCQPGYTRWGSFGCRKCKSAAVVALAMVGLVVLVFVVISYLIISAIKSGAEKTPVGTAAIKVAFSHIQTVAIAASFNLEWPDSVLSLFAGMSTATSVSSEVLSLDCALPSDGGDEANGGQSRFFDKAAIVLAMPLLMLAVAAAVWSAPLLCSQPLPRAPSAGPASAVIENPMQATTPPSAADLPLAAPPTGQSSSLKPTPPGTGGRMSPLRSLLRKKLSLSVRDIGVQLSTWDKILSSAIVILFLVHMSVSTTSLQLLTCRDVSASAGAGLLGDGGVAVEVAAAGLAAATSGGCDAGETHRRLVQDLEVCCYDKDAQRSMYGLGIPGLLVYALGIPVAGALLLWWRRDSLQTHHTKTTLGFLYAGFKDEAYYWESVVMLRKVLVAVIAVSLEPMGVTLQTYTALALIFALALLHAVTWPYADMALNRLELGALVTAFVTFECGLFLTDPATSRSMRIIATMVIFFANLAFMAAAAVVIVGDKLSCRAGRRRSALQASRAAEPSGTAAGAEASRAAGAGRGTPDSW